MKRISFRPELMRGSPRMFLDVFPEKLTLSEPFPGEEKSGPKLTLWYADEAAWAVVALLSQGCASEAKVAIVRNPVNGESAAELAVELQVRPIRVGFLSGLVPDFDRFEELVVEKGMPVALQAVVYGHPDLLQRFAAHLAVSGGFIRVSVHAQGVDRMSREVWCVKTPVRWGGGMAS